jgi:LAO/AO transport system kinase
MQLENTLADLRARRPAGLARAISIVENGRSGFEQLLTAIHPSTGRARRIGLTGPPGAGKSTLAHQLTAAYRAQGLTVAVVAVDPTSPFTGGALLGDRIRMEPVSLDEGVFIRSMATRGSLGGLATSTREVCDVLDAAGFDRLLIETVGVGQSELDVATMADSTVLVLVPESGDGIQALKSGVMEIADLFVVNKADRPGAEKLQHEIDVTLGFRRGNAFRRLRAHHGVRLDGAEGKRERGPGEPGSASPAAWEPPVLLAAASRGEGTGPIVEGLDRHFAWLTASGQLAERRRRRLTRRTQDVVRRAVDRWMWRESQVRTIIDERLDDMVAGRVSPYDVAADVVAGLREGVRA